MTGPLISIVIPTYNEERGISSALSALFGYLSDQQYRFEVIISDDGSTDATVRLARGVARVHPELRVLANDHRGKGYAVRKGMQAAGGDIVLFSDADLSTPIQEIENLLPWFREGYDVVIGSREGKEATRVDEPILRRVMGRVFNRIVGLVAINGIRDTQCGFKAFSAAAAARIFERTRLYGDEAPVIEHPMVTAFDVEVLYVAANSATGSGRCPSNGPTDPKARWIRFGIPGVICRTS